MWFVVRLYNLNWNYLIFFKFFDFISEVLETAMGIKVNAQLNEESDFVRNTELYEKE